MWGNLQGWGISAVMAAMLGYLLWQVAVPPSIVEPTNAPRFAVAKKAIELPVSPATVAAPGTQACDAADAYRKAIAAYQSNPGPYEKFLHGGSMTVPRSELTAIDEVIRGRDCSQFNLFSKNPREVINYENQDPAALVALQKIGEVCCTTGLLDLRQNQPDEGKKILEAAFVMGVHLYEERVRWKELEIGHGILQPAARNLATLYVENKDTARAEAVGHFMSDEAAYMTKLTEAYKYIGNVDEGFSAPFAGDIFAIARSPQADRMFRVEALKHVGHYRFNAQSNGEQVGARGLLPRLIADPTVDPAVKAAATAANELTLDEHNKVGGGSSE